MPHLVWTSAIVAATLAGLLAGGCSTNLPSLTSQPDDPSAALAPAGQEKKAEDKGPLASLTAMLPEAEPGVVGTPTELYTRIARGALNCWFGATGPLKGRYIYHADAKPASQGGGSVIVIRERDLTADDPRSLRAFRVKITPGSSVAKLDIENSRIAKPLAERMTKDVRRWAADDVGCHPAPQSEAWAVNAEDKKKPDSKKKPGKRQ